MIDKEIWNVFYHLNPNGGPWDNPNGDPDQHIVDFLKFYNFPINSKILDVGCGYGKNSLYMIKQGYNVVGIDVAQYPISKCRENFPAHTFLPIDMLENNFQDKSFDTIVDAGALHVNEPSLHRSFFEQYHRTLKDESTCFIRIFNTAHNSNSPIFFVYLNMPVYGKSVQETEQLVAGLFKIEKVIFDKNYGMHGEGCNFYYLKKI
jgi:2-polyprenyl-3-methyl-5-hydroxy-6-metoxy-1,4-benzoquinol methylase